MAYLDSILDFYKISLGIEQSAPPVVTEGSNPKEIKCKRIQSFGVIYNRADLNTDNLFKDLDTAAKRGVFFSRDVDKISYPAHVIYQRGNTTNYSTGKDCYRLTHYFVDQMPEGCNYCSTGICQSRLIEEQHEDLKQMARRYFSIRGSLQYGDAVFYNAEGGTDVVEGWHDINWLNCQDNLATFICKEELRHSVNSETMEGEFFTKWGTANLAVLAINEQVCVQTECPTYKVDVTPGKPIYVNKKKCNTCP